MAWGNTNGLYHEDWDEWTPEPPLDAEEWAIWGAMWSVPEVRRHYQVHHDGPLTYPDLAYYMGPSDKMIWSIQDTAIIKLRAALAQYLNNDQL